MQKLSALPFLMFQGEAPPHWTSRCPDARIDEAERYERGKAEPQGSIKRVRFTIGGQSVLCTDSFVKHAFSFTPSFSFLVECCSADEVKRLSDALKEGKREMMPGRNYNFSTCSPGSATASVCHGN